MNPPRGDRGCEALAELRSALVDGALDDAARERVLAHLVVCDGCRAEVQELRRLRRLLNGADPKAPTPDELSDRLVAIAGSAAAAPLWVRPFTSARPGSLPSTRRTARTRAMASALTVGAVSATLVGIGLIAAPPLAASIPDPTGEAQVEFSTITSQLPLSNESVSAVMLASRSSLATAQGRRASAGSLLTQSARVGPARTLSAEAALSVLRRAAGSADALSYTGSQSFTASVGGRSFVAQIRIDSRAGQGREVAVYDSTGRRLLTSFSSSAPSSRVVDLGQLALLSDNYLLAGRRGAEVADRAATVVEAYSRTDPLGRSQGPIAARWWVDDASGLLLAFETYDITGTPTMAAGFTKVQVGKSPFLEHLPPRLSVPLTTSSLTLATVGTLAAAGWVCPDEIAGLSLVRLRADDARTPTVLHMAYSDGLSTVSVFEQRGSLKAAPADSRWDPSLRAYVRAGTPSVATWQSGSAVFTVVTDGSDDVLAAAVTGLPHEAAPHPTTIERVRAGWARILDSVMG